MTIAALAMVSPGHAADPFGNGTIKTPTTASGGTGIAANLQTDDDVNYTVAKRATASIGGFGTHGGAITSVYLFVQYTVETGYTGTTAIQINGVSTTIVPAVRYIPLSIRLCGDIQLSLDSSFHVSSSSKSKFNNHQSSINPLPSAQRLLIPNNL